MIFYGDIVSPDYIQLKFNTFKLTSNPTTSQIKSFKKPINFPETSMISVAIFTNKSNNFIVMKCKQSIQTGKLMENILLFIVL